MEAGCPHAALRPGAVAEQCPFLAAQGRLDAPAKFAEPVLDTGDIQADVVLGVNMKQHLLVVYYDITDAAAAKRWLREDVLPNVTTADNMRAFRDKFREARLMAPGGAKPVLAGSQTLNISFSYAGLTLLDAPDVKMFEGPDGFGTAFSIDLPKRAGLLGDLESGCPPSGWLTGGARSPHVLIQIGTDSLDEFEALRRRYAPFISEAPLEVAALDAQGVKFVHADEAHRLDSRGSEQFGFHDAVSNPALRGYYSDGVTPLSTRTFEGDRDVALPGQDLLYPGEFIVLRDQETDAVWTEGLASEGGARQPSSETWKSKYASTMPDWAANGAFLVNRRLRQDVSGFWSWCEAEAQKEANASHSASAPLTAEAIAARLFGRWPSGCPLARSPLTDIAELGDDKLANNAYAFAVPSLVKTAPGDAFPKAVAVDVDGIVCPLSAHTRKMNPRDGPNDVSTPLKRRLMRRGLPYGPQLVNPKSGIDDGKDRGLMFIAYCSSIEEQFEFLQRKWANSEHSPTDPTDIDPIIGQVAMGASKPFHFTAADGTQHVIDPKGKAKGGASQFVFPTGGGYFFAPSISALMLITSSSSSTSLSPRKCPGQLALVTRPPSSSSAFQYNFPGALTDLPPTACDAWSSTLHGMFTNTIDGLKKRYGIENPLYFSKVDEPDAVQLGSYRIVWDGFAHKFIALGPASDGEVFKTADTLSRKELVHTELRDAGVNGRCTRMPDTARELRTRAVSDGSPPPCRQMDEYCEWFVSRDERGKVISVEVTTELPEYYAYMHSIAPATILDLYRQHVSPLVQPEDLLGSDGKYDKYNVWNTQRGMMHLQQPADTAPAAISISGSSTVQMVDHLGRRIAGKQKLMEAHGDTSPGSVSPVRGSDPSITQTIYELTAPGTGAKLTLADPIGVYMDEVDVTGWAAPDGTPLRTEDVVTVVRGQPGATLRYLIRVPDHFGYMLGDCTVGGQPISYGGQVVKNSIQCYLCVETYRAPKPPLPVRISLVGDREGSAAAAAFNAAAVGVPLEVVEVEVGVPLEVVEVEVGVPLEVEAVHRETLQACPKGDAVVGANGAVVDTEACPRRSLLQRLFGC